ncbi:NADP-dependent glyceraldehyde-3-phosphate dehydrogenase [Quillaja saponaria]|uniref:NADP-dependent glyceraldehyde-3-phosphate dehydrogenase n=1 Tax=Quillaja saponaria TaxID=32244 RepID=A0AAD7LI06_QUISA|nr:NADP-dependent glyceraldehyde-3-phosphate dehydrogenase [Quillaja saponaria]
MREPNGKYCLTSKGAVAALHMVHCFHLAGIPKGFISCISWGELYMLHRWRHLNINLKEVKHDTTSDGTRWTRCRLAFGSC